MLRFRYDKMLLNHTEEELNQRGLIRCHPDFRVIALGVPVPAYPGFPLDPPLRSEEEEENQSFSTPFYKSE